MALSSSPVEVRIRDSCERGDHESATTLLLEAYGPEVYGVLRARTRDADESLVPRLEPQTLTQRHRALAEAYEVLDADAHERLAIHWRGAGESQRAYTHARAAAERAFASMAFDHAAELLAAAVNEAPDAAERALSQMRLADTLAAASRPGEAAEHYLRVARESAGELARRARRRAAEQLVVGGHTARGLAMLDDALAELGLQPLATSALPDEVDQRVSAIVAGADAVRPDAALEPLRQQQLDLLWSVSSALHFVSTQRARELQSQLVATALDEGEASHVVRALGLYTCGVSNVVSLAHTEALVRRCYELLPSTTDPYARVMVRSAETMLHFWGGHPDEAARILLACQDVLRQRAPASSWAIATGSLWLSIVQWTTGRQRDLRRRWEEGRQDALERHDEYYRSALDAVVTPWIRLCEDDPEGAFATLDDVGRRLYQGGVGVLHAIRAHNVVLTSLYAGQPERGLAFVSAPEQAACNADSARRHYTRLFGTFTRALATLLVEPQRSGQVEAAIRRLEDDVVIWADAPAALLRGALEWHDGHHEAACAAFDTAERRFAEVGFTPSAMAARHARGRALAGDEGASLERSAESRLAREGVANPPRFLRMLAPLP